MENKFVVAISEEDNREIEKSWYEYNASQSIVQFLMKDKDIEWGNLQDYINVCEYRWIFVERLKRALGEKYKPDEVDLTSWDFAFDFDEKTIIYTLH